jgi:uncharacterized membrane protein YphA (DoxX/SURF4 family)
LDDLRGNWQEETKLWQVALLRIFFGYYFLLDGLGKLTSGFTSPGCWKATPAGSRTWRLSGTSRS